MQSRTVLNLRWTLTALDQLQSSQTCVTVLADDDVVVHGNAERGGNSTIAFVIWISAVGPSGRGRGGCAASDYANQRANLAPFGLVNGSEPGGAGGVNGPQPEIQASGFGRRSTPLNFRGQTGCEHCNANPRFQTGGSGGTHLFAESWRQP
jgi:hypothetical protein